MLDGHPKHFDVDPERPSLNIIQVILQSLADTRPPPPSMHLRPTSHPHRHGVPEVVIRQDFAELFDKNRPFRARSHQAHLALQDVPKLWQFVEIRPSQKCPKPGAARICRRGPDWPCLSLCIALHAPEFQDFKRPPTPPDPRLTIQNRPA